MKSTLLEYIEDVQSITCAISCEPIYQAPVNVGGLIQPVELANYHQYIDGNGKGFVSVTNRSIAISAQEIVFNHELHTLINNIHLAIVNTIDSGDMTSLERFLEDTNYSITSIIRINNKATMILSYVVSKNMKLLSEPELSTCNINIIAESLSRDHTVFDDVNSIINNAPLLYYLVKTEKSRQLLLESPGLVTKITPEGLNHIILSGPHQGQSALLWLAKTTEGQQLLLKSPGLVEKITPEGLNHIISGPHQEVSVLLYILAKTTEGRQLLLDYPGLVTKITPEGLNHIITSGPNQGESALFLLAGTPEGQQLLLKSPRLVEKITPESLNQFILSGPNKGQSALVYLAMNTEGRQLLIESPRLVEKITPGGLNQIIPSGPNQGKSALSILASTPEGERLLSHPSAILEKVSQENLRFVASSRGDAIQSEHEGITMFMADIRKPSQKPRGREAEQPDVEPKNKAARLK